MPAYVSGVPLVDQIYLVGTKFSTGIRDAIIDAKMDSSIGQVTQITLKMHDRGLQILGSGLITTDMRADFIGYTFNVASVNTDDQEGVEVLTVQLRPMIVRLLQERQGVLSMANVSPTQFIASECAAVGANFVGQPSQVRNQVSRDVNQGNIEGQRPVSTWTTISRLAGELGYVFFEYRNTIYFGKPSWLIANMGSALAIKYEPGVSTAEHALALPACSLSLDNPKGATFNAVLPIERIATMGLGQKASLSGVPLFNGDYLVDSVSCDLLVPEAVMAISAQKPVDPVLSTAFNNPSGSVTKYGLHGTKNSQDFMGWLIKQLGDRYVFGAPTEFENDDPGQFDCSSFVQWGCHMVGVYMPRTTYEQEPYCASHGTWLPQAVAAKIPGAVLFAEGHVAVSMGNGRDTIEAMNDQAGVCKGRFSYFDRTDKTTDQFGRFRSAYLIPDMIYPPSILSAAGLIDNTSLYL